MNYMNFVGFPNGYNGDADPKAVDELLDKFTAEWSQASKTDRIRKMLYLRIDGYRHDRNDLPGRLLDKFREWATDGGTGIGGFKFLDCLGRVGLLVRDFETGVEAAVTLDGIPITAYVKWTPDYPVSCLFGALDDLLHAAVLGMRGQTELKTIEKEKTE